MSDTDGRFGRSEFIPGSRNGLPQETHDFQADIDVIGNSTQIPVLLETVLMATGMGFAAVARVTSSRWVTCRALDHINFGLKPGDELEVESTLCHEVRQSEQEIVIDDVSTDRNYCDHHTPARYGFRSYVSIPIYYRDGRFFGTLCAIDPEPRRLSDERVVGMFRLFASLIGESLETDRRLLLSEQQVGHERHLAEVQQRFISILAHDLRNPVSVLEAGLRILQRKELSTGAGDIVSRMRGSVQRMGMLIENLLSQARKRQDGGIVIVCERTTEMETTLEQLVGEHDVVMPDRSIMADIHLPEPIVVDVPRITQLLSNLLGNAVTYGAAGAPIRLDARLVDGALVISVSNEGDPIPDDRMESLFLPFEQGGDRANREGLGLGLYIASEIAQAHGGTLTVSSDAERTVFTFTMPDAVAG
jgi:signal transduction histidine kinase